MVLYLKEYAEQIQNNYASVLNYYDKLPRKLHEMNADDIIKEMNRNGSRSFYLQKAAINNYLMWLSKNSKIDIKQLYYDLNKAQSENFEFLGFYDFKDLQQSISEAEYTIETLSEKNKDFNGLYAIFYLEWLGVLPESAISIRLEDVTDMGKRVYVPVENRTIEVQNEEISDYFWKYKNTEGRKRTPNAKIETPYKQYTFYRTIAEGEINLKTIYNIRGLFVGASGDERFAKKRIYYSGRYYEMYRAETNYSKEFELTDDQARAIVCKIFNSQLSESALIAVMRDYRVYKKNYLERL